MIDHSFKMTLVEYSVSYEEDFYSYVKNFPLRKYEYNNNSYFIEDNEKKSLTEKVNKYIKHIADSYKATLIDTWIQQYNENQFHDVHIHGEGHLLSFVWYIDCTKNSSKTIFHNQGYPYINTNRLEITPEKNKLILFDGTIPHYVLPNKDTTRLVISGNLKKWLK